MLHSWKQYLNILQLYSKLLRWQVASLNVIISIKKLYGKINLSFISSKEQNVTSCKLDST